MFLRLVAIKQTKSKRSDIYCCFPKLDDMVRMWAKVSLDMMEGVDGFLDLVKALKAANCSKKKKKNNFDICIS